MILLVAVSIEKVHAFFFHAVFMGGRSLARAIL